MAITVSAIGKRNVDSDGSNEYVWEIINTGGSDFTYTWQAVGGEAGSISLLAGTTTFLYTNTLDDITLLDGATTVATGNYVNTNAPALDTLSNGSDNYVGHLSNDNITGANGNDTIDGSAGNDTINGGAGDDLINGGDVVYVEPVGAPAVISPNDPASIVMGSGGVQSVVDNSGNGNTLFQNDASRQPTLIDINGNNALNFDGVNDHLDMSNSNDINGVAHTERSIFMSVNTSDDTSSRQYIYEEGGRSNGFSFYLQGDDLYAGAWRNNGNDFDHFFSTSVDTNTTYTIGLVFDFPNNSFTAYVDGASIGTGVVNHEQAAHGGDITFGANGTRTRHESGTIDITSTNSFFKGQIGDFALYNNALNAAEVAQITGTLAQAWGSESAGEDDSLSGGDGNDTIFGGVGDDIIDGGNDNDSIDGGAGNDNAVGGNGSDTVNGGVGNDTLNGGDGNDTLDGGVGNDALNGGAGSDTLLGRSGNDFIAAGDDNDNVNGGSGNDGIYGESGDDILNGSTGNDTVTGGVGNDTVFGGDDNDTLSGDNGDDSIDGDAGDDSIDGGANSDTVDGGSGSDTVDGGAGNDTVEGGTGSDTVNGGDDDDFIIDVNIDGTAFDTGVADALSGGAGDDILVATSGADQMWGGSGSDTFVFTPYDSVVDARVYDFQQGVDQIFLIDLTPTFQINPFFVFDFDALNISVSGGNTHITFANGSDIQVDGVTNITAADFDTYSF
ncbi:MAG: hypothetical protein P8P30_07950 [Rickettsiales bacterium]|nr:hypothetical protein [Rickettsiales bacterium]